MARQAEKGRYSDCDRTVKYDVVNNNNNGLCLDGNMENFNAERNEVLEACCKVRCKRRD